MRTAPRIWSSGPTADATDALLTAWTALLITLPVLHGDDFTGGAAAIVA